MCKMAIITGAGTGIGYATAMALIKEGIHIIAIGRQKQPLEALKAICQKQVTILPVDVASREGRCKIAAEVENISHIDYLIHAAAIVQPISKLIDVDLSSWETIMRINLESPIFLTQLLINKLKTGRVLFISSGAAFEPVSGVGSYCISKTGLAMAYECFKIEMQGTSIAFGSVLPGVVATPMHAEIRKASPNILPSIERLKQLDEEGKLIPAKTVAKFIKWLLLHTNSEEFSHDHWNIYDIRHHQYWLDESLSQDVV